jgi:uncharacterized protein
MHRNPFRYGAVVAGEDFADREGELAQLVRALRGGEDVCLIAPRRYGKTSLVLRAVAKARAGGVGVAYLDLFRTPTKERLAEELARAIHSGLVQPHVRARRRALAFFQSLTLRPTVTVASDGTLSFGFTTAASAPADLDRTIEELFALAEQIRAERGRPVAIVLDEFQEIVAIDPALPRLLRASLQLQGEVAHLFLGSRSHFLRRVFTEENEPFYRSARIMELGPIPAAAFAAFVRERFAATGRSVDDAAVAAVLAITGGHPHNTQELCHFLWDEAGSEAAGVDAVERALERLVDAEEGRLVTLVEGLSRQQRLVLWALAQEPGRLYSAEYRRRRGLPPGAQLQRAVAALLDRDLIAPRGEGGYEIADPFLAAWLLRG